MKFIKLSILVGLLCAIPICAVIYLGVDRLEKNVPTMRSMQEVLSGDFHLPPLVEEPPEIGPVKRRLTNEAGRQLDTVVTGRSVELLHFFSYRHNRHFRYPIAKLSTKDQAFAAGLPLTSEIDPEFPVIRELTDREGTSRLVVIEGRAQFDVVFRLFEERQKHTYPINRLSPQDRDFVFGLPVNL